MGVFLGIGTGVFLGGGTRVVLREGTGVAHGGGFPLGVVDPGPPIDTSKGLGVLFVGVWMTLNISLFWKSSLK